MLVYLVIAISQLRLRQRLTAQGKSLGYRMWLFPWLTWGVIVFICSVLVVMLLRPDHRLEVVSTMVLAVLVVCSGLLVTRRRARGVPINSLGQGA
ncbi:GABA permease [Pseudomonas putida]|nr:GABA permease [Pseudomonas putida]